MLRRRGNDRENGKLLLPFVPADYLQDETFQRSKVQLSKAVKFKSMVTRVEKRARRIVVVMEVTRPEH